MTTPLVMPDAELAAFASPGWVERIAKVPLEEMAAMVAEDPSTVHALIGALRHAREQLAIAEVNKAALQREKDELLVKLQSAERSLSKTVGDLDRARARLELGREHVRRGRSLFTPHVDGTTADFKLGLSMVLDHLETALAESSDG